MKRLFFLVLPVFLLLSVEALPGLSQEQATVPSLGDLARELRAQRQKSSKKARVFTNDNLPARTPEENQSISKGMSGGPTQPEGAKAEQQPAKPEAKANAGPAPDDESPQARHDEKYFRKRMSDLRAQLDLHQRELDVLEKKLSQGQLAYYPDPNKTLTQESTPAFYSDQNKLREQVNEKQAQIAEDQKAIQDLQEQLRREGGEPGWIR
jgi:chromosome segregation ATPase